MEQYKSRNDDYIGEKIVVYDQRYVCNIQNATHIAITAQDINI